MEFHLFSEDSLITHQFYIAWLGEVDNEMSVRLATGFPE